MRLDKVIRRYEKTPIGYKCDVHYYGTMRCTFDVYTYENPAGQRTAQIHAVNYGGLSASDYLFELSRFARRAAEFYMQKDPKFQFADDDICALLPELSLLNGIDLTDI